MTKDIRIIIVNENDEVIGSKEKERVTLEDIYRVTGLWLTNSRGEILLAQRAFTKSNDPGKWGPAVAGTVENGETYEDNIKKETFEELGVSGIDFIRSIKTNNISTEQEHKRFVQWFRATIDKKAEEFAISESEVVAVKWFIPEELRAEVKTCPNDFLESIQAWAKGEVKF